MRRKKCTREFEEKEQNHGISMRNRNREEETESVDQRTRSMINYTAVAAAKMPLLSLFLSLGERESLALLRLCVWICESICSRLLFPCS